MADYVFFIRPLRPYNLVLGVTKRSHALFTSTNAWHVLRPLIHRLYQEVCELWRKSLVPVAETEGYFGEDVRVSSR